MQIIFEFAGGPMDGKTVAGQLGAQDEADRYFALTHHGRIGQRFRVASNFAVEHLASPPQDPHQPRSFQQHSYVVSDRVEGDDELLVRVEYLEPDRTRGDARPLEVSPRTPHEGLAAPHPQLSPQRLVGELLEQTAHSIEDFSGPYLSPPQLSGQDLPGLLAMHLAHVLLAAQFSVVRELPHRDPDGQALQLLAISPSQDWFLACRLPDLTATTPATLDLLQELRDHWLRPERMIPDEAGHLRRVATHCEYAIGVLAGLVQPEGRTELVRQSQLENGQGAAGGAHRKADFGGTQQGVRWLPARPLRVLGTELQLVVAFLLNAR